jgi:hypothetical protein
MGEFMFSVAAKGKANAVFDTADEALRFSMGHVYLSPSAMDGAKQLLERGEPYSYAYGFAVASITPVAKNPVSPSSSKKVIDDLKRNPAAIRHVVERSEEIAGHSFFDAPAPLK